MPVHQQVLDAAVRLCAARATAVFAPDDIVRALPHLNAQTVRTHVTSRCCVNAPKHHQSRLRYFRKVGRGRYELLPEHRTASRSRPRRAAADDRSTAETQRDTVHAVVTRDPRAFVVDCLEVAVVTQGRTLDEALANFREALALHLEGEDLAALGLGRLRRIHVTYEMPASDAA
jgi:hypothetical protein